MSQISTIKNVDFRKDFICGGFSGYFTGWIFLPAEYAKVVKQSSNKSILNLIKQPYFMKKILKGTISFPILVGCVGSAQFTANDKIRQYYGKVPGIIASAMSGSLFLAPGDHYMLRQEKYSSNFIDSTKFFYSKKGFFVGFVPTALREAIFMTNLIYIGPLAGQIMKKMLSKTKNSKSEQNSQIWRFVGRSTFGIISTLISHPFDVAARQQQILFGDSSGQLKVNFYQALRKLKSKHQQKDYDNLYSYVKNYPWFKGAACRMWLGTFGGAVLGGLYERFSNIYDSKLKQ